VRVGRLRGERTNETLELMLQECVDCKRTSQETNSSFTLISTAWRLTREKLPDGTIAGVWRCPECWAAFKRKQKEARQVGGAAPSVLPPPGRDSNKPRG
jgi:hypothetical protein